MDPTRPTLPFLKPIPRSSLPPLPARPAQLRHPFGPELADWVVTTHVFPAAAPRSLEGSVVARGGKRVKVPNPLGDETRFSKEEHAKLAKELFDRQEKAKVVQDSDKLEAKVLEQHSLYIAANRYRRPGAAKGDGTTIVIAHATGLHKETWEPALRSVLLNSATDAVSEIWALDTVQQGDSALLNIDKLGNTLDWRDLGRDVAGFVLYFLPERGSNAPTILEFHNAPRSLQHTSTSPSTVAAPTRHRGHRVVGLGHSLGSASMIMAASLLPSIFHRLILCDPVMFPPSAHSHDDFRPILAIGSGAMIRREVWAGGRDEAETSFKKSKGFFGIWHPEVLKRYVACALVDRDGVPGAVRLKALRQQEALVFADPKRRGSQACFNRIATLPPHLSLHYIFAGSSPIIPVWAQPELLLASSQCAQTTNVALEGAGHLLVQERPTEAGALIARYVGLPCEAKL